MLIQKLEEFKQHQEITETGKKYLDQAIYSIKYHKISGNTEIIDKD